MTPEEREPSFDAQLESCLLHGPVDDAVELLHSSGESAYVLSAIGLEQAVRNFEAGGADSIVMPSLTMIERPEVVARCLYEFERRDKERGLDLLLLVEKECVGPGKHRWSFSKVLGFLDRLRENGDGGSDGGAGDREPLVPHGPHDSDAIALDPPEDTGDVSAVGVLDRSPDDQAA